MWLRRSHSELVLLRCSVVANFHKLNGCFSCTAAVSVTSRHADLTWWRSPSQPATSASTMAGCFTERMVTQPIAAATLTRCSAFPARLAHRTFACM